MHTIIAQNIPAALLAKLGADTHRAVVYETGDVIVWAGNTPRRVEGDVADELRTLVAA